MAMTTATTTTTETSVSVLEMTVLPSPPAVEEQSYADNSGDNEDGGDSRDEKSRGSGMRFRRAGEDEGGDVGGKCREGGEGGRWRRRRKRKRRSGGFEREERRTYG